MKSCHSVIAPLLFCLPLQCSDTITYLHEMIGNNPAFMSSDGWGSELLLRALDIRIEMFPEISLPAVKELSIAAMANGIYIGFRHCNWMKDHAEQMAKRIVDALPTIADDNIKKYMSVLLSASDVEHRLIQFLYKQDIFLDDIVHNCGLLVLEPYQHKGIGTRLQQESINMLKGKGVKAIVSETTNYKSAAIMKKCGFIKFAEFPYRDFDIEFNDSFTIWYLILN